MTDPVAVDLEDFDVRDRCISEIRIYQQGGTEVSPLPIQPLLFHILSSACPHGLLRSMDIMQESISGGGGKGDLPQAVRLGVGGRHVGNK